MDPEKISGMGKSYAYIFGLTTLVQQVFYLIIFVGSGIHYYSTEDEKAGAGLEKQIENIGNPTREKGNEEAWLKSIWVNLYSDQGFTLSW
jgi:hypothetical protein